MPSTNWKILTGTAMWCTGVAASGLIGALFSRTMTWDLHLALFFAWTGLLAFAMTWAMASSAFQCLAGLFILMVLSSLFGVAILSQSGPWAWAVGASWFLTVAGAGLVGAALA